MNKKIVKKILFCVLMCGMLITTCSYANAGTKTYTGTYSMKAGVFCTKAMNVKSKLEIDVWPDSCWTGTDDVNLSVWTAKKNFFGNWTIGSLIGSGPSTQPFFLTYKHKGKIEGLYFMNPTRVYKWTGHFNLRWDV